ncbi:MAG: prepilin-type N-terminal cleavage/methylation domain-containing protein [Rhizomicrobium sp.]
MTRTDSGYTILETLCALAILSVALVLLYGASATSLTASDHIANIDRVALMAQSKLDEIAATRSQFPAHSEGAFSNSDIRWTITADTIFSPPFQQKGPTLQAIHLELLWREGLREQSFAVDTRHLGQNQP